MSALGAWGRLAGGLGLVVVAVFGPALAAGHVYDDVPLVLQNTELQSLARPWRFFVQPLWQGTPDFAPPGMYHRPLPVLSFAVDQAILGGSAALAHLHSLLWHLGAVAALGALLRGLGLRPAAAAAGLVLFALHPAQVEPVVFVAARNDLMATALLLAGLAAGQRGRWGGMALALLLAGLSKESALLAPLLVLGMGLLGLLGRPPAGEAAPEATRRGWLGGLGLAAGAVAVVGALRLVGGIGLPPKAELGRVLAALPPVAAWWAGVLTWPVDLVPGMHLVWAPPPGPVQLAGAAGGAALVGAGVLAGGRRAILGLCIAVFGLVPALAAVAQTGIVPDRYLYLPLAGLALVLAAALERLPPRALAALVPVGLGLALLSARTVPTWQSDRVLWTTTLAVMPTPHAAAALAKVVELEGELDEAAALYRRALVPPTPAPHACWNIARLQLQRGDPAAAARDGLAALDAGCPRDPELLAPTALGLVVGGAWDRAEALALDVPEGGDPTGQAVLVRLAVGLHRGETGGIAAVAGPDPARQRALGAQVDRLLAAAGDTAARERLAAVLP